MGAWGLGGLNTEGQHFLSTYHGQTLFLQGFSCVVSFNLHYGYLHFTDTKTSGHGCLRGRSGIQTRAIGLQRLPNQHFQHLDLINLNVGRLKSLFFPPNKQQELNSSRWTGSRRQFKWIGIFFHVRSLVWKVLITVNRKDCSPSGRASAGPEATGGWGMITPALRATPAISRPRPPASGSSSWQVQES